MRVDERWGARRGAWSLLALTACGGGAPSPPSAPDAESSAFSLAVIGSSTAAGEGASRPDHAWVAQLGKALAAASPCFIDVFTVLADPELELAPKFDAGDGIHLNDAGHTVVFGVAEPIVQRYVCSVTACR